MTANPFMKSVTLLKENVAIIGLLPTPVRLDKPIFIGVSVLDLSKLVMYRMYDMICSCKLIDKVSLIGGDTDSFFLHLFTRHTKEEILDLLSDYVDTSNFPPNHPLFSNRNKSKLGCFKDETKGRGIAEFIALCPKLYSFIYEGESSDGIKRMKGIKMYKRDEISHNDYKRAYMDNFQKTIEQNLIRSRKHQLSNIRQKKCELTVLDTKRVWVRPNVSYPIGNKSHLPNHEIN